MNSIVDLRLRLRLGLVAVTTLNLMALADGPPPPDAHSGLPKVRVIATDPTALEGGSTGAFTFVRDAVGSNDLALQVTYGGSATNGVDYLWLTNVVTITAGQLATDVLVQPIPEVVVGHDRKVVAHLQPSDTYEMGSHKSATVTIVENRLHTLPPTVDILTPTNGAVIHTTELTISAQVQDLTATISRVLFYSGEHLLHELDTPPYQWTWTHVPAGGHTLRVWAQDAAGSWTQSDPVTVTITNGVPVVAWLTPTNGTVVHGPAPVTLSAQASDGDAPIVKVDFSSRHHLLGIVTNGDAHGVFSLAVTNFPVGHFKLHARAVDQLGRETLTPEIDLFVTNAPPTIRLTSPLANSLYGVSNQVTFTADAEDSDDSVAKVEFVADGIELGTVKNPPWTLTATNVPPCHYKVRAKAVDTAGLSTWSAPVSFRVTNITPTIVLTVPVDQASFKAGQDISVTADPTVADGSVKSVTFYVNGHSVGTVASAPYTWVLTKLKPGAYRLKARVQTNYGISVTSEIVHITVTP